MGLETATTINQLVTSNPLGTDSRSQGDDHIRLIKSTLKNTFPNITAPVTVTQDQINAIGVPGVINFSGMIVMWSGTLAQVPTGWKLCDGTGTLSNGNPIPDLRGRFIIGSGGDSGATYNTGATGGTTTHSHTITIAGTALTVDQIPAHSHTINGGNAGNFGNRADRDGGNDGMISTNETGGGKPHTHTATETTATHLPPYFSLAFIIKV